MEKVECPDCGRKFDTSDAMNQHKNDKHMKHEAIASVGVKKPKITFGKILTYGIIILVAGGIVSALVWALTSSSSGIGPAGSTHIHQDWKVYLNGVPVDFSIGKYQKPHINQKVHLEGGDGDVIHVHATGMTMGFFLDSLDIQLTQNCLIMDTGEQYCNDGDKSLKFYVNGNLRNEIKNYVLNDLDKILISYGNDSEESIEQQLASITDKSRAT